MSDERIVAALDIGTSKVFVLIGEMDDQGEIYVIGHGRCSAEGLRRGVVVDMDKTVKSIRKAVDDAQLVSGVEVDRVTVGIAGEHIRSINSHGVVAVGRSDNEITTADVQKAIEAARTVAIPVDREIIHVVPQSFSVDDQSGIKDPKGMTGVRLEVEAHIVTASVTSAKNIYRALERCGIGIDAIALEALAQSQVLLDTHDIESGCVLMDIGGDITNISMFFDGAIRYTAVIPLGAKNVTNDIAIGLRTSVTQAEELKLAHGAALTSLVDPTEMIVVPAVAGRSDKERAGIDYRAAHGGNLLAGGS
jgi:cell division protein FtsA